METSSDSEAQRTKVVNPLTARSTLSPNRALFIHVDLAIAGRRGRRRELHRAIEERSSTMSRWNAEGVWERTMSEVLE